ncbi:23S rRNA (pseudouridine(1915)-N(3))-methyltransferase RlmH [Thermosulfurimonas dismutans]|uniref:Ribosomal RNA large subunit methyltransferase H n=1 Tax=Thermosulfurimonas dismutans TaxID=999894 RepID=A0A179D689_9BACT|nr:23S rRNA (pseudouridine(1915)-N(3))-methyltransferase RlmH [Thermosulfurimonas dismutans]OAQ21483.1 LSU m3Psi1915 methyltransferase RlmH [Thermosulfurimonas dismutans]
MRFPVRLLLMAPGPLKFPFVSQGIDFYRVRVKPFLQFETLFPKVKATGSPEARKQKEAETLMKHIPSGSYVITLDEKGQILNSPQLSEFLGQLFTQRREIVVVAGGPDGLADKILRGADFRLSLSALTLNHEIALLVFCEALYRSLTILSGSPYHRP